MFRSVPGCFPQITQPHRALHTNANTLIARAPSGRASRPPKALACRDANKAYAAAKAEAEAAAAAAAADAEAAQEGEE